MGARSDDWPTVDGLVTSYVDQTFEKLFGKNTTFIRTLSPERTFWEKATILHAEYYRPETQKRTLRVSRHYYDLHQMHKKGISDSAMRQIELFEQVAKHKSIFFYSSWARYENAKPGTLRLLPRLEQIPEFKRDYNKMQEMFFTNPPTFDAIMDSLKELENKINHMNPDSEQI